MKRRFPIIAALCIVTGIIMLCGLGVWQLERLQWKTKMLVAIDREYTKDANRDMIAPRELQSEFDLRRGTLQGRYDFERQSMWMARIYDKMPGFDVLTPLKLEDNSYILVNRGWAAGAWDFSMETARPEGWVSVTGAVRKLSDRNPFTPSNRPQAAQWYYPNPHDYAGFHNIEHMHPYILFLEGESTDQYPLPRRGERPEIANNHFQYALFWFGMAGLLAVMALIRFLMKDDSA